MERRGGGAGVAERHIEELDVTAARQPNFTICFIFNMVFSLLLLMILQPYAADRDRALSSAAITTFTPKDLI